MSADNWAVCPRCLRVAQAERAAKEEQVRTGYGVLPLAEFDALRAEVAKPLEPDRTFREDYEIGVISETGIVDVRYRGGCTVCGLGLDFNEERPIPGIRPEPIP